MALPGSSVIWRKRHIARTAILAYKGFVDNEEPLTGKEADMTYCTWNRVSWQINSIRNSLGQQQGLPFGDLLTPEILRGVAGQAAFRHGLGSQCVALGWENSGPFGATN
jgi:hypothetical protein